MFTRSRSAAVSGATEGDTPTVTISTASSDDTVADTAVSSSPTDPLLIVGSVDELPDDAPICLDTPTITHLVFNALEQPIQCGVPTLTTPTLTPTTLRNIEQSFQEASEVEPPEVYSHQAGFVPPLVHPTSGNTFISIDNKNLTGGVATLAPVTTSSGSEHTNSTSLGKLGSLPPLIPINLTNPTSSAQTSVTSAAHLLSLHINTSSSTAKNVAPVLLTTTSLPGSAPSTVGTQASTVVKRTPMILNTVTSLLDHQVAYATSAAAASGRRMGGRRPANEEQQLSAEEEDRRRVRRERNKQAAARCRKRRLDQTNDLQDQTDQLEEKKASLQHEIDLLQQQQVELEFLLETHKAVCSRSVVTSHNTTTFVPVSTAMKPVRTSAASAAIDVIDPGQRDVMENSSITVKIEEISDTDDYSSIDQPTLPSLVVTSLPHKPRRPTSLAVAPLTDLGVSIETPSAGLHGLNFESMMEGGTGLTPVACASALTSLSTGMTPLTTPVVAHPSTAIPVSSATNCSKQQRSSSSDLSSPDSVPHKLVSL